MLILPSRTDASRRAREELRSPLAMPLLCPICKSPVVQELDRTGDAISLSCPEHGNFKVADTVFAEAKAKDYTRERWEAALDEAKQRTEPAILSDHISRLGIFHAPYACSCVM